MKPHPLLLLICLLTTALAPQQDETSEKPARKKNPVTAFFEGEGERMRTEVEGSWVLFDYTDPLEAQLDDTASGFALFHDGFMTLMLSLDVFETYLFQTSRRLLLHSGAYRYRFDEQANLQLSSVMGFSNENEDGDLEREPVGEAYEYVVQLDDGVLELRNPEGIRFSFRKVTAGDFPDSTIRKLEGRRGGQEHWETEDGR